MFSFYFPDVNVNKNVLVTVKYVVKPLSKEINYDEASFRVLSCRVTFIRKWRHIVKAVRAKGGKNRLK